MIGWLVAAWLFLSACYWVRRARKAEARVTFWQDECRRVIQAQALAETAARLALAENARLVKELTRAVGALEFRQAQDSIVGQVAHNARRLH